MKIPSKEITLFNFGDMVVHKNSSRVGNIVSISRNHPFLVIAEFEGTTDLYAVAELEIANDLLETDTHYLVSQFNVLLEDPQVNTILTASLSIPDVTIHNASLVPTTNQIELTYTFNNNFRCGSKKLSLTKAVSLVKEIENKIS